MLNKDHDLIDAFSVEYIISRLRGKAARYTIPKRQENIINLYSLVDDIVDQLVGFIGYLQNQPTSKLQINQT